MQNMHLSQCPFMKAIIRCHDIQHIDTQDKGFFVTLSINATRYNITSVIMLSVIMLSAIMLSVIVIIVAFYLLLC
jgi:hypothetical protein